MVSIRKKSWKSEENIMKVGDLVEGIKYKGKYGIIVEKDAALYKVQWSNFKTNKIWFTKWGIRVIA